MIISFLLHIIGNATAILVSAWLIPRVLYEYEIFSLIKIALMLATANALIKPVLKLIFSPLILVTLGLFTFVINIFLIWLVTYFSPELSIVGIVTYFLVMIIVSFFNFFVSVLYGKRN